MNIYKTGALVLSLALLIACGSSSSNPDVKENNPPVITTQTTHNIQSGGSFSLTATVSDPEHDSFKINWNADNSNVTFSNNDQLTTLVTFPETNVDLLVILKIVATDNQGLSSEKDITVYVGASTNENKAPFITLSSDLEAVGGQNVILIANVQDPEGDAVSVEWSSNNNDIAFSDKQSLTTTTTLPYVTEEVKTTIIITAIDEYQNKSQKKLYLTIKPNGSEPEPTVNIELFERFDTVSGEVTNINARLISNVELNSVLWDISSLNVTDGSVENTSQDRITLSQVTFTAPEVNELTKFLIRIRAQSINGKEFYAEANVFVAVDNTKRLKVNLSETFEVSEGASTSITPIIESSHVIDSYQWRWLSNQPLTLLTPTNKVLSLSAPTVDNDIIGQLELTVVMGNISKTVTTELTIKDQQEISDVNVIASKLILVKGQDVTLSVITDNFDQIKSWSWEVSGVVGSDRNESKNHFEITAPEVNSQQNMEIIYRATLIDNSEVMKIANVTILSKSNGRSSFTFHAGDIPIIFNDIEKSFTVTFIDPHGLVDTISLDQSLTSNTFDIAEITRSSKQVNFRLKTSSVIFNHIDFMYLKVKYGDYQFDYPIQLDMRLE